MGRQQFTMYTSLTFFTSLAYQWFTCLLTLVYENTTCFGVSSCRLLSLGEEGVLLYLVCPQPAGWLSRLGLYIPGCLQPVGPCLQCILVGSSACVWAARCPPQSVGRVPGSGPLMGSESTVIIHPQQKNQPHGHTRQICLKLQKQSKITSKKKCKKHNNTKKPIIIQNTNRFNSK